MSVYRSKCIDAKGNECHLCGAVENIDVHHIDGDQDNDHMSNLIPVCRTCHREIHAGTTDEMYYHRRLQESSRRYDRVGDHPEEEYYCDICDAYVQGDATVHDAVFHPDALRHLWLMDDLGVTREQLEEEIESMQKMARERGSIG